MPALIVNSSDLPAEDEIWELMPFPVDSTLNLHSTGKYDELLKLLKFLRLLSQNSIPQKTTIILQAYSMFNDPKLQELFSNFRDSDNCISGLKLVFDPLGRSPVQSIKWILQGVKNSVIQKLDLSSNSLAGRSASELEEIFSLLRTSSVTDLDLSNNRLFFDLEKTKAVFEGLKDSKIKTLRLNNMSLDRNETNLRLLEGMLPNVQEIHFDLNSIRHLSLYQKEGLKSIFPNLQRTYIKVDQRLMSPISLRSMGFPWVNPPVTKEDYGDDQEVPVIFSDLTGKASQCHRNCFGHLVVDHAQLPRQVARFQ